MKRALVVALIAVMAVAMETAAQGAEGATESDSEARLVLEDRTGDLSQMFAERPANGPSFVDLTAVSITKDGDNLLVRFDVAGSVPTAIEAAELGAKYTLLLDADADKVPEVTISIMALPRFDSRLPATWQGLVHATRAGVPLGDATIGENSLEISVPIAVLDVPEQVSVVAEASALVGEVGAEPTHRIPWDRAGGKDPVWSEFQLGNAIGSDDATQLRLSDAGALFTDAQTASGLDEIHAALLDRLAGDPLADSAIVGTLLLHSGIFPRCEEELRSGTSIFDDPTYEVDARAPLLSTCTAAYASLLTAYVTTGDDAYFELMREFVGTTLPLAEERGWDQYVVALESMPQLWTRVARPDGDAATTSG